MKEIKKDQPQTDEKKTNKPKLTNLVANEKGRVGYIIAWMMGVPASVLLFIFLLRGH